MVFLNNLSPVEMDYFFPDVDYSFSTGARVSVHARDTLADMTVGVNVSPGVETILAVDQVQRIRLTEPWGICTDRQHLHKETEENAPRRMRYTIDSCLSLCAQYRVGKKFFVISLMHR